ncbi:MAG: hypothetical protein ACLFTI_13450 [Anaerolineales bacterium]
MFRRNNPYSCIEEMRRSRAEVLALVLITVVLGILLGLLTDGLSGVLQALLPPVVWYSLLGVALLLTLALTLLAAFQLYGSAESRRARPTPAGRRRCCPRRCRWPICRRPCAPTPSCALIKIPTRGGCGCPKASPLRSPASTTTFGAYDTAATATSPSTGSITCRSARAAAPTAS